VTNGVKDKREMKEPDMMSYMQIACDVISTKNVY